MICTLITQNSSRVLVLNQVDFITVIFSQSLDYEKQVLEIFSVADGVYYQLDH
jgi:DNA-dependent RNA polymerase auxiliary subunit epsilon